MVVTRERRILPAKKTKFVPATERATLLLQEHFESLPAGEGKKRRAEFHRLSLKMGRGSRGKA
jgi:hypothetical protein